MPRHGTPSTVLRGVASFQTIRITLSIIAGYLMGSLSPAYILDRLLKGHDIRTMNFRAAGARNIKAALELGYTGDSILNMGKRTRCSSSPSTCSGGGRSCRSSSARCRSCSFSSMTYFLLSVFVGFLAFPAEIPYLARSLGFLAGSLAAYYTLSLLVSMPLLFVAPGSLLAAAVELCTGRLEDIFFVSLLSGRFSSRSVIS